MLRRRGAEVALAAVLALVEGEVEPRAQSGFGGREPGVDRCLQARPGVVADGFLRRRPMGRPWWRDAALAACDQLLELEPIAERARAIRCSTPARRSSLSTRSITARPSYHDRAASATPNRDVCARARAGHGI